MQYCNCLLKLTELPVCTCVIVENAYHVFYVCNRYHIQRQDLLDSLSDIPNLNLRKLLYGNETLSYQINVKIFLTVW